MNLEVYLFIKKFKFKYKIHLILKYFELFSKYSLIIITNQYYNI